MVVECALISIPQPDCICTLKNDTLSHRKTLNIGDSNNEK